MSGKVVAIGIDAPNSALLDAWLESGRLPHLRALADQGVTRGVTHVKRFRNERCWELLLSGRSSAGAGSVFVPGEYRYFQESLQRRQDTAPFYSRLGASFPVCAFDLPTPLVPHVHGFQVTGWGSELSSVMSASIPAGLLPELQSRHGRDPKRARAMRVLDPHTGEEEESYVLPSLYGLPGVLEFKRHLLQSIESRTAISIDLLDREDWSLFLGVFSEAHSANHMLWHLGEPHPLAPRFPTGEHAVLEVVQAIDRGIGRIRDAVPADRNFVVFTIDHVMQNTMDVASMALLPELLYRWNFPGSRALAGGRLDEAVPELRVDYPGHWKHEVWALCTSEGSRRLSSPDAQESAGDPLSWNPANWYRPLWPTMTAFALPSVSDGYVRVNVQGRERDGNVPATEFRKAIEGIAELLQAACNPRTGRPAVKELVVIRETPWDRPEIPPDLVVCWDDASSIDVIDSPAVGRIGPLPYFRSGGHVSHGTLIRNQLIACGPDVPTDVPEGDGRLEDIPATILGLMGVPEALRSGRSLLERNPTAPATPRSAAAAG